MPLEGFFTHFGLGLRKNQSFIIKNARKMFYRSSVSFFFLCLINAFASLIKLHVCVCVCTAPRLSAILWILCSRLLFFISPSLLQRQIAKDFIKNFYNVLLYNFFIRSNLFLFSKTFGKLSYIFFPFLFPYPHTTFMTFSPLATLIF